jgi:predicted transcriptional regulator
LASKADVPQPAIARIESGAVSPRVSTLQRLLAAADFELEAAPRIGAGVDRTLIRASIERSPEERIRAAARSARHLRAYLDAAQRGPPD